MAKKDAPKHTTKRETGEVQEEPRKDSGVRQTGKRRQTGKDKKKGDNE